MDDQALLQNLVNKIKAEVPGFELRYKDESLFMKVLGVLVWVFNRRFMRDYTTTVSPKVYFPSRAQAEANPRWVWKILTHEYVHLHDWKRSKVWFTFSYLLPQILALGALGALGAFWNLWFLLCLGFLVFAAPWGSRWRTHWELRGYTMSMAVNYWRYGSISDTQKENIARNFYGMDYYRMCPNKEKIRGLLQEQADAIASGAVLEGEERYPFRVVYGLLQDQGAVKVA